MGQSYTTLVGSPPVCTSLDFRDWCLKLLAARMAEVPLTRTTTYYVDQVAGSDSNDGLTTGTAWKTWAKVNTFIGSWTSVAGGIAIGLKRGCEWHELTTVTVASTKKHITFFAYGNAYDAKPLVSAFTLGTYDNGWALTAGKTYTYERSETNDVAWFREGARNRVYTRLGSIAAVEAMVGSFWWDVATNKLYVHPWNNPASSAPNFDARGYRAVKSNTTPGLVILADDVRVQDIVFEGHGCNRTTPHNAQWGITVSTTGTDSVLVSECEVYHTATHNAGHSSTGGGVSTWVGCRFGLFGMDGTQGGTAFAGYSDTGGHEVVMFNTEYAYGGLPTTDLNFSSQPMLNPIGTGYVFHTGASGTVGMMLLVSNTFLAGLYQCTNSGGNNNPTAWTDLKDCRSWRDSEKFYSRIWIAADAARSGASAISGSDPAGTYSVMFNGYSEGQILLYGGQNAFFSGVGSGVHWNNKAVSHFDSDPSVVGSQFNYYGYTTTATGNALEYYFCHHHFVTNTRVVPSYCTDSAANGVTPAALFKNCILSADGNGDNANYPTYVRLGAKNNAANLVNNFYSGFDTTHRTNANDGYSADTLAVEGSSTTILANPPPAGSRLVTTTPQTIRGYRLEYDAGWRPRNKLTALGPNEVLSPRSFLSHPLDRAPKRSY